MKTPPTIPTVLPTAPEIARPLPDAGSAILTEDSIKSRIYTIRGVQVMLDRDLAALYGVETESIEPSRDVQPQALSRTLHVLDDRTRGGRLEVTNCDLKYLE